MRRITGILFATASLALCLAACAPAQQAPAPTGTQAESPDAPAVEPTADDETPIATLPPVEAADALCREGQADGDDVCVITGRHAEGDLSFEGYEVVKLIDSTVDGAVAAGGLRELVVTGSQIGADLSITRTRGVVVKQTEIGGSLDISDAQHATLVKNTVGGDLNCHDVRADGNGNRVKGATTCSVR
ncbi:hypothetical protein L2X99_13735 [Microbacterium sp. KUDC0406]|uniref:hypothetical protein n=1 Tax=Microbacterium sp. KUDC0406 TaxID=2909588 RepID=UPI001F1DFD54|nr:hypothetical protein [Microbacterium sp. KUDC0406]UJP09477.1 hypothetical protein L2X99_13735 [Microbacterium sp. KUDC0406]